MLLVNSGDGLVVGIEGSWGTGKSTVIGFIKGQMSALGNAAMNPIVVDFNPWMVSNTGALVDALVTQIAASIQLDTKSPEKSIKAGQKLFGYIGLLKHLKYLKYIPGTGFLGNIAEDAAGMANTVGEGVKAAQDGLTDMEKILPAFDLSKRKAEVVEALHELDRPIVVIVDDLDRLPADEIRLVVQTIKAVADFPRTTYLLAYDREIVAKALGNGDPATGLAYLEKIVQVAYPIPPLFQHQLRKFADTKVKELLVMLDFELRNYESAIYGRAMKLVTDLARHPRDIIRVMNRLILSIPATRGEVNTVDVILLEALSQRFPSLREKIHSHPADFIGNSFRGDMDEDDSESAAIAFALGYASAKNEDPLWEKHLPTGELDQAVARKACAFLFASNSEKTEKVPEDELRVADPDRLARYFQMTSLDSVPEASEIHKALSNPGELATMLEGCNTAEVSFLLEWIFNYAPSCPTPDIRGSLDKLISSSGSASSTGQMTRELTRLYARVLERLLGQAPLNSRNECFNQIINGASLSIAERILLTVATEHGRWIVHPERVEPEQMRLISDNAIVEGAIKAWSDRVRESSLNGTLFHEPRLHAILYRFAQLGYAYPETYEVVKKICSTDTGLKAFLSAYVSDGHPNSLEDFSLIENAQLLAERISRSSLRDEYAWFSAQLLSGDFPDRIREQAARLRSLKIAQPVDSAQSNIVGV